jgi:TorA maturation chaperone TorD
MMVPSSAQLDDSKGISTGASPCEAGADARTAVAALGLLAHWWSRPLADEVGGWFDAKEIEAEICRMISGDGEPVTNRLSFGLDEVRALLDEYERLFVGPGHVSCPPYESFWREDVPIDIRRSLIGPCTAELRQLYETLEIEVAPATGEMPDHIAVELEALSYALSFDETAPVARALFFDHVRRWLPRLCRAVVHEAEHPFYGTLGEVTLDWLGYVERYLETVTEIQPETP